MPVAKAVLRFEDVDVGVDGVEVLLENDLGVNVSAGNEPSVFHSVFILAGTSG